MSTRAKIGIVNADKTVTSIHLWRDGYPEHAGQILTTKYKTAEQIEELMSKGNLVDIAGTTNLCNYEEVSTAASTAATALERPTYSGTRRESANSARRRGFER